MDKNPIKKLDIESFSKKETYTAEEKKIIMDRLNKERLIHQKVEEGLAGKKKSYSKDEKKNILTTLNEKRLSTQKREEIKKSRTYKKQIYKFEAKEFYKFVNMEREYYIKIADCKKISSRPTIATLYYRTFESLQKKDVLLKAEVYSEKFFISHDVMRVYYKGYSLEDEK